LTDLLTEETKETKNYFKIGTIVKTQGLRGELRVFPTTDEPSRFELLESAQIFWDDSQPPKTYAIERVRFHKNLVIIKLDGIDDCTAAEQFIGTNIKIPREDALPLDEDEYYQADLLDMPVFTETGEKLGTITQILQTGANDIYVVSAPNTKDLLLPAIKDCIVSVEIAESFENIENPENPENPENKQGGKMIVRLLEGLREL